MFRNRLIQEPMPSCFSIDDIDPSRSLWSTVHHQEETLESGTRLVWVTNYSTGEDFPINVPIGDPLNDDQTMIDLSTLNLNELLVLLYRLQQQSEHSSRDKPKQDRSPTLCRRLSAFNLSNLADAPKHLTNTLSQLPSSLHNRTNTSIHSPNDVVVKLEQSLQMQEKMKSRRLASSSSIYSYHHSQQHKAKVISNLLSSHVHHR